MAGEEYTTIPDEAVAAGGLPSGETVTALRDNVPGSLYGTNGAPVPFGVWHPYNMANVGDGGDGVIWEAGVDANTATIETPVFEDGFSYRLLGLGMARDDNGTLPNNIDVDIYRATDASYATLEAITIGDGATYTIELIIERPWLAKTMHPNTVTYNAHSGFVGGTTNVRWLYDSTVQIISKARLFLDSTDGNVFNAGQVILERKLDYLAGEL